MQVIIMPKPGARKKHDTHYSAKADKQERPKPSRGDSAKEFGKPERPTASKNSFGDRPKRKEGFSQDKPRGFKSKDDNAPFGKSEKPYQRKEDSETRPRIAPAKSADSSENATPRKRKPLNPDAKKGAPKREMGYTERKAMESSSGSGFRSGKNESGFGGKAPFKRDADRSKGFQKNDRKPSRFAPEKKTDFEGTEFTEYSDATKPGKWNTEVKEGPMTLNKYVAHSGVCSRRDAAVLIKDGKVMVNGEVLKEPGYRVKEEDQISMDGNKLTPQKNFVYVLLNKPKDFLTTTEDDRGRRTVMELVKGATDDRLYPIGRLDRNTTGILLLTNDGDLAQKLSHPKFESKKIYQVTLDKDVTKRDFEQIVEGVVLEDGPARVDRLSYLEHKNEIGLEIHSGRNRIVRRIFESLGYEVVKLDRVVYAGLTKKNVSRGSWRFLTDKEIINLKHFKN